MLTTTAIRRDAGSNSEKFHILDYARNHMRWSQWASLNQETDKHITLAERRFQPCQIQSLLWEKMQICTQEGRQACSPCLDNHRTHFLDCTAARGQWGSTDTHTIPFILYLHLYPFQKISPSVWQW